MSDMGMEQLAPVFIGSPRETFTPTQSGALATIMHGCCVEAQEEGIACDVIANAASAEPFAWPRKHLLPPRCGARQGVALYWARLARRMGGWSYLGHGQHAWDVLECIRTRGLGGRPLVIINDPELAVYLRGHLPKAWIAHWFQNQLECKPAARRAFAGTVDQVVAVSDFTGRWVAEWYGVAADRVRTVYNAVDSAHFSPGEQEAAGPVVFNFVGRTGIEKAPDLLLKAALRLAERRTDFGVQLVGSNHFDGFTMDDYQRELAGLSAELEQRGVKVVRTGHVGRADLPGVIRRAHVHVVTSRWDEPFGLTTLEGMACGLATIGSRTGGTPEVIGEAGLLFERDDVVDLARQMGRVLDDGELRRRLGAAGQRRAEEFNWRRTWRGIRDLLPQGAACISHSSTC